MSLTIFIIFTSFWSTEPSLLTSLWYSMALLISCSSASSTYPSPFKSAISISRMLMPREAKCTIDSSLLRSAISMDLSLFRSRKLITMLFNAAMSVAVIAPSPSMSAFLNCSSESINRFAVPGFESASLGSVPLLASSPSEKPSLSESGSSGSVSRSSSLLLLIPSPSESVSVTSGLLPESKGSVFSLASSPSEKPSLSESGSSQFARPSPSVSSSLSLMFTMPSPSVSVLELLK